MLCCAVSAIFGNSLTDNPSHFFFPSIQSLITCTRYRTSFSLWVWGGSLPLPYVLHVLITLLILWIFWSTTSPWHWCSPWCRGNANSTTGILRFFSRLNQKGFSFVKRSKSGIVWYMSFSCSVVMKVYKNVWEGGRGLVCCFFFHDFNFLMSQQLLRTEDRTIWYWVVRHWIFS